MSVITFVEKLFGDVTLTAIETDLATAEKVVLNGLTCISSMVAAGATASETVVTELEALLPKVKTAVANAAIKAKGWEAELKAEITAAETWIAARVVTAAAGADGENHGSVALSAFRID